MPREGGFRGPESTIGHRVMVSATIIFSRPEVMQGPAPPFRSFCISKISACVVEIIKTFCSTTWNDGLTDLAV